VGGVLAAPHRAHVVALEGRAEPADVHGREAGEWLRQAGFTDTWLLIKGSRSTKMEEVLN